MEVRTYVCLFDLKAYDDRVAPAMRRYVREFDPAGVVALLEKLEGDYKHWIDSIGPDKGFKPTERTVQELCDILIPAVCLPKEPGLRPMQEVDTLAPWLSQYSEWFADMMEGGEELAGGRLEFGFGDGRLVATKEQIAQFLEELEEIKPPTGALSVLAKDFANLRKLLERAAAVKNYTLFRTAMAMDPAPPL